MQHKKFLLLVLAALMLFSGCKKQSDSKAVTFFCKGDFALTSHSSMSKDLSANGTAMTDVWVFDYVGGTLVQTIHQDDNTATDFGQPSLDLSFGTHTLYFVASRGLTPTVNTSNHSITWVKPSDTFHKAVTLTVDNSTSASQPVTLERMVAKVKFTINDAIATGTSQFLITPHLWYYGMDYTTGDPAAATNDQTITVNCPSANIGLSGQFVTVYTFSSSAQWQTNITFAASNGTSTISSVSIPNVPIQRNHSTDYSGNLFTNGGTSTLTLNDTWDTPFTGTW